MNVAKTANITKFAIDKLLCQPTSCSFNEMKLFGLIDWLIQYFMELETSYILGIWLLYFYLSNNNNNVNNYLHKTVSTLIKYKGWKNVKNKKRHCSKMVYNNKNENKKFVFINHPLLFFLVFPPTILLSSLFEDNPILRISDALGS